MEERTGEKNVYSLKRSAQEWGDWRKISDYYSKVEMETARPHLTPLVRNGMIIPQEAKYRHIYMIWEKVALRFGFEFSRKEW